MYYLCCFFTGKLYLNDTLQCKNQVNTKRVFFYSKTQSLIATHFLTDTQSLTFVDFLWQVLDRLDLKFRTLVIKELLKTLSVRAYIH